MQIDFTKSKWYTDDSGTWLSLLVKRPIDAKKFHTEREATDYTADLKKSRKKRSLDANSYFWVLCGKLAATLGIPKEDIYRGYIKGIGDNFEIIPIRDIAVETWIKNWQSNGIGWQCEILDSCKFDGYTKVVCYYGSSTYNTKQMSTLIDLVVFDCKDQGIDTMTPAEIDAMKSRWKNA